MTKKKTYFHAYTNVDIGAVLSLNGEQIATYKANASLNAADFEIITGCGIGIYDGFIVTQAGVFPPCKWPAIWAFSTRPRMC